MVQPGFFEVSDLLFGQTYAGGDQVGVETQPTCFGNQFCQVLTHQRFAAGKTDLRRAHLPCFTEHLEPLFGGQLLPLRGEIQRVGAVRALQRAAIRQLGQ